MPTTELMIAALTQHREAPGEHPIEEFWKAVERYRADLYNQALALLRNSEDAEDVVQETLRVAFQKVASLQDPSVVNHWLRRINRNIALRLLRRRRTERKASKRLEALGGDPAAPAAPRTDAELRDSVIASIDALPDSLRVVVVLRYWERLSYEQIAERLGLPIGTVGSRMVRADRILKRRLGRYLGEAPEA